MNESGEHDTQDLRYDFNAFAVRIKGKQWLQMVSATRTALQSAEFSPSRVDHPEKKHEISVFEVELKKLSFFLTNAALPQSRNPHPPVYKEIAETLVANGDWLPATLDLFKNDGWERTV